MNWFIRFIFGRGSGILLLILVALAYYLAKD
jgi:hypothetical protein